MNYRGQVLEGRISLQEFQRKEENRVQREGFRSWAASSCQVGPSERTSGRDRGEAWGEGELVRLVVPARCPSRCLFCLCQVIAAFRQGSQGEETKGKWQAQSYLPVCLLPGRMFSGLLLWGPCPTGSVSISCFHCNHSICAKLVCGGFGIILTFGNI